MDIPNTQPEKIGLIARFLIKIAGVDEPTLRLCPQHDWDNVRAVAEIMICTWLYQAALFAVIGHRLFAAPDQIRADLIAASVFIATFIMLIDSYMVMRSGWHLSGIEELKRGGLDISGGAGARIKAGIFLTIRILLSIGMAQLTAVFFSLLIFNQSITATIQRISIDANAHLIPAATTLVDGEIQRATDVVASEMARHDELAGQVTTLRQNQIDPSLNNPQLQQAGQEVGQLTNRKEQADDAVTAAQTFASNERGGIKGAPGNSGRPGDGARYKAAMEGVSNAKGRAQEAARALDAAQARLDTLRTQLGSANEATKQRSHEQLPVYEDALAKESDRLTALQNKLAELSRGRDGAIRNAVENAPDYVSPDNGLLAQIAALRQIAETDHTTAGVVLLIDFVSFGFELAAVVAKITSFVPTTYAALLARDAYMRVVRMVDDMMRDLSDEDEEGDPNSPMATDGGASNDNQPGLASIFGNPYGGSPPPKRPRGRPRKNSLN